MSGTGRAEVSVPASSANLGPGFDAMGLAVELRNTYSFEPASFDQIEADGKFGEHVPKDVRRNLAFRAFRSLAPPQAGPYHLHALRLIPAQGGLGSSASAIVGGLMGANQAFALGLTPAELLRRAVEIEGHPDNVAPALLGGLVLVVQDGDELCWLRIRFPSALGIVLVVPNYWVPTSRARRVLPDSVPRADAVANVGRVAMFIAALQQERFDLLRVATEDALHQPYRESLNPALRPCLQAALAAEAYGAALSGSGPTILAFAPRAKTYAVAGAMGDACLDAGHGCETYVVGPAFEGARVTANGAEG